MEEEWRDIQGYEGLYQVSNLGDVKSLPRWRGAVETIYEQILSPIKTADGYLFVRLFKDGKAKFFLVHRLVADAFIPNPYGLNSVRHIDGNKGNNRAENLEWGSRGRKPATQKNTTQGGGKMAMAKVDDELTKLTRLLAVGFGCAGPETRRRWEILRIEKVGETDYGGVWELKIRAMPQAQPKQEAEND